MYIEVSGRRSGKTIRMVDDIVEKLEVFGLPVYLTCLSPTSDTCIRDMIPEELRHRVFPLPNKSKDINWALHQYYDEVDLIQTPVYTTELGYYCGTPSTGRLQELVAANNDEYIKYDTRIRLEEIMDLRREMSDKKFRSEILGEFVT